MLPPLMLHCCPHGLRCLDVTFFSFSLMLMVVFRKVSASRIPLLCVEANFVASKILTSWSPVIFYASHLPDLWSHEGWWCFGHDIHLRHVKNGVEGYDYWSASMWGHPFCTRPDQDTTFTRLNGSRVQTIDLSSSCIHHTCVHGLPSSLFQK